MHGCPQAEQVSAGLFPIAAGLQPVTAASPRGHICTCTSAPAPALESKQGLSRQHQHLPPLRLSPAAGRRFVHPPHTAGAVLSSVPISAHARGQECCPLWSSTQRLLGTTAPQQIFQNEGLQSLIIHPQSMEALCPDKQTSTVASVQPAAGLALIQARGKAFCLN